jgi:hypothetical protein
VFTTVSSQDRSGLRPDSSSGRAMFSATLRVGSRLNDWKTNPARSLRSTVSWVSDSDPRSRSPRNTWPELGWSRPARQCMSVDFPDPEGPMIAVNRPRGNSAVTWSSAVTAASPAP